MSELQQFVNDALGIKFGVQSHNLLNQLKEATLSARYGEDAFLRSVLNSTVGGAVAGGGVMLSEATVVAGASKEEKDTAVATTRAHLAKLLPSLPADTRREA